MLQKWAATAARALRAWYVSADTDSASAAGGLMAQSGSNVLVTCRSSVRQGRTAASPSCQLEVSTPMHSSQLCLVATGGMAFDQQLRGEAARSGVSSYT